jgi:hypothetical protein
MFGLSVAVCKLLLFLLASLRPRQTNGTCRFHVGVVAHQILVAAGEACTIVLRGSTNQMVDETEGNPGRPWRWMLGDADELCG